MVTAQLLDGATAICAWARHYDRDVRDIFALQEALSRDIAEALRLNLLPGELETLAERPTASVEAYQLYLLPLVLPARTRQAQPERQSVVEGKVGSVRLDLGGRRYSKKKK